MEWRSIFNPPTQILLPLAPQRSRNFGRRNPISVSTQLDLDPLYSRPTWYAANENLPAWIFQPSARVCTARSHIAVSRFPSVSAFCAWEVSAGGTLCADCLIGGLIIIWNATVLLQVFHDLKDLKTYIFIVWIGFVRLPPPTVFTPVHNFFNPTFFQFCHLKWNEEFVQRLWERWQKMSVQKRSLGPLNNSLSFHLRPLDPIR